jgi:hypothetical protein
MAGKTLILEPERLVPLRNATTMEATMKLRSALMCLCLLAVAAPAFAQLIPGQLYLNQNECSMVVNAHNKDLACATTVLNTLVCSAKPVANVSGVIADLGYVDVVVGTDPVSMPPFWHFETGGCAGSGRILFSADFTTNTGGCADVWAGLGSTGGQWGGATGPTPDGNRARVKWTTNVTPDLAFPVAGGTEAYIEKISLRNSPAATCAGCNTPACAVFLSEGLYLFAGGNVEIQGGAAGTEWFTFNDSQNATHCPAPTPTRSTTWGQVKSLYR